MCVCVDDAHAHNSIHFLSCETNPGWAEIKTLFTFPLENSKIFMQEIKKNCFSFSNLKAGYYFFKYYLFFGILPLFDSDSGDRQESRERG